MRRKLGFSLVELVIVVVIIGVIAAIAIPRMSRAARGAADAALWADLAGLRNCIDMYAAEHGGAWPGADGDTATLIDQLTKKTDVVGNVGTTAGVHIYGPYLRRFPPIPVGPNIGATQVITTSTIPLTLVIDESDAEYGWIYNFQTGDIIANTDDLDDNGVGYDTF